MEKRNTKFIISTKQAGTLKIQSMLDSCIYGQPSWWRKQTEHLPFNSTLGQTPGNEPNLVLPHKLIMFTKAAYLGCFMHGFLLRDDYFYDGPAECADTWNTFNGGIIEGGNLRSDKLYYVDSTSQKRVGTALSHKAVTMSKGFCSTDFVCLLAVLSCRLTMRL